MPAAVRNEPKWPERQPARGASSDRRLPSRSSALSITREFGDGGSSRRVSSIDRREGRMDRAARVPDVCQRLPRTARREPLGDAAGSAQPAYPCAFASRRHVSRCFVCYGWRGLSRRRSRVSGSGLMATERLGSSAQYGNQSRGPSAHPDRQRGLARAASSYQRPSQPGRGTSQ